MSTLPASSSTDEMRRSASRSGSRSSGSGRSSAGRSSARPCPCSGISPQPRRRRSHPRGHRRSRLVAHHLPRRPGDRLRGVGADRHAEALPRSSANGGASRLRATSGSGSCSSSFLSPLLVAGIGLAVAQGSASAVGWVLVVIGVLAVLVVAIVGRAARRLSALFSTAMRRPGRPHRTLPRATSVDRPTGPRAWSRTVARRRGRPSSAARPRPRSPGGSSVPSAQRRPDRGGWRRT